MQLAKTTPSQQSKDQQNLNSNLRNILAKVNIGGKCILKDPQGFTIVVKSSIFKLLLKTIFSKHFLLNTPSFYKHPRDIKFHKGDIIIEMNKVLKRPKEKGGLNCSTVAFRKTLSCYIILSLYKHFYVNILTTKRNSVLTLTIECVCSWN